MSEGANARGSRYKVTSLGIFLVPCALRLVPSSKRNALRARDLNNQPLPLNKLRPPRDHSLFVSACLQRFFHQSS
jgi:hypothetical protein